MLKENVKDAGEIIQNILSQPLDVPGGSPNISLLAAALKEDKADLKLIMESFARYPEATRALVTELELLAKDLHV